ncbi:MULTISPECIES: hypothetical protein [unclassified Ruegeria]|uniref:hypothetical protein n=1 Tax=unclassified Ruegeria TaxID=2625375 RepID=UPI001487BF5A|nr:MULTISPECIES: hypothetical protein [unclassified Ruegeria]NOD75767.1 hypothetical protein [Ruegeria sp. HKCCD4332]NOD88922.1 hypothetical protein [Ruegeria sp. HKCCD4318]NOE14492.1 hypothetical protein [Ruegeria sp. HKCCD4318-2]NOG09987.1 hypothetical protein [Ruegeria sp. HKCCD4315]
MSGKVKIGLNSVVFLIATLCLAVPSSAQTATGGPNGLIAVSDKQLSFLKTGHLKIKRYYLAPKSKAHVKQPKVHHKKHHKTYRFYPPKRRVIGRVPYGQIKRHKFNSLRFKHKYGFRKY